VTSTRRRISKLRYGTRGEKAVEDMKARIAAGWTVEQLWERFFHPDGFTYDMAEDKEKDEGPTS
jgi:hypothetical protein